MQKRIAAHTAILFKYQFFILIFSAYLCLSVLFSRDHDHCACRKCKYKREERRCFVSCLRRCLSILLRCLTAVFCNRYFHSVSYFHCVRSASLCRCHCQLRCSFTDCLYIAVSIYRCNFFIGRSPCKCYIFCLFRCDLRCCLCCLADFQICFLN